MPDEQGHQGVAQGDCGAELVLARKEDAGAEGGVWCRMRHAARRVRLCMAGLRCASLIVLCRLSAQALISEWEGSA